ncbi:hypothetical protein KCU88_g741, partial [Aureobasidium melanogenum]
MVSQLYLPSHFAKIWGVAMRALSKATPPLEYPEYTPPGSDYYVNSSFEFWTSGFFPGCLYLLYERQRKWPWAGQTLTGQPRPHPLKLRFACAWWTENLHDLALKTDTHDLGFMIQPWAQLGWELDHDSRCHDTLVRAARALASRYDPKVGCIRSWDVCFTRRYAFDDPSKNFLVIIDNMMNLDLLYYVANLTANPSLSDIATAHAFKSLEAHVRPDWSTCHVADFDNETGELRARLTNQGYSDTSCWARGQAWGICGFAQAYKWTNEPRFLEASQNLAKYFVAHLPEDNVPYWDFDAPKPGPRDTSAALVAAYGLILLHETTKQSESTYLDDALRLVSGVLSMSLAPPAKFVRNSHGDEDVDLGGPETIILNATINNYEFAPRRWADHGLVYADYYFLLIGNKLCQLGIQVDGLVGIQENAIGST